MRGRDEASDERLALRVAQVARDGLLVARLDQPPVGGARRRRATEPPEVVTDARLLHLDDLGTELAEERGADGRGQERREVEHADAREGGAGVAHGRILPLDAVALRPDPRAR